MKKRKFRLFGAPLSHVIVNGQLPDIIQVLYIILSLCIVVVSIDITGFSAICPVTLSSVEAVILSFSDAP